MCGIAGILRFDEAKVTGSSIDSMTDILAHRGPDGGGAWISENQMVGLGHRRLSVIDLSIKGHQPMHYQNKRYSITYNGEIYNYLELKETLIKKGNIFTSETDTEVLLALYAEKKEKCLEDLDGMFAFAIWDEKEQELFCARDRFGEKPFYFYHDDTQFVFASEMKALFSVGIDKTVNQEALYRYLVYNALVNPQQPEESFYTNIHSLASSSYLRVKKGRLTTNKYWELGADTAEGIKDEDAIDRFRELFTGSIKKRLRADVPVGSSLSGGLDSSAIVKTIDNLKNHTQLQKTFSARFEDFDMDEGKYMEVVINQTSVEPHFTWPSLENLLSDLDALCYHQEQPVLSASAYAQWEVMKLTKENGVTVLLDGQGADELLAGYIYFYEDYFRELYRSDKKRYHKEKKAYDKSHPNSTINQSRFLLLTHFPQAYLNMRNIHNKLIRPAWLNKDLFHSNKYLSNPHNVAFNSLNEKLHYRLLTSGLNNLLHFADRSSMAFSREVRLPFLSHELVEFVMALPLSSKMRDGWTKYVFRKAMDDILPPMITWRKDKIGFAPPHKEWMSSNLAKEKIHESRNLLQQEGVLDKKNADKADPWKCLVSAPLFNKTE